MRSWARTTREIGENIQSIQDNTSKTVDSLEKWQTEVKSGLTLAQKAGQALDLIVISINNVTNTIQHIATSAEEQSHTGDVVASNVEFVANLARQSADNVLHSSEAINNLNGIVHSLQQLVGEFKLKSEQEEHTDSSDPTQAQSTDRTADAVINHEDIKNTPEETNDI